jgi:hypothetical protein
MIRRCHPPFEYMHFDLLGRLSRRDHVRARMPLPDASEILKSVAGMVFFPSRVPMSAWAASVPDSLRGQGAK